VPDEAFSTVAAVLGLAAVLAAVAFRFRQPLLIGFVAGGVLAGPAGLGWVRPEGTVVVLAELGLTVLLFLVGLRLDLHLIRTLGPVALATGLGQVLLTTGSGFGLARALGYGLVPALYIALALCFSSTIIVVKLLSDTREIDQPHGRIAVGLLIVQDMVVVLVMIALSTVSGTGQHDVPLPGVVGTLAAGGLFLAGTALLTRYVLPSLLGWLARSTEVLLVCALAWGVALAAVSEWLGFSTEVGAFLGGVSLASTPYRAAIAARLVFLRDFLLIFFFVDLGARLDLDAAGTRLGIAAVLSLFVLVGKPLVVLAVLGLAGYRRRTSFLAGVTIAQVSEFSLVLVALGLGLGHVGTDVVGLVTAVAVVTITASTYLTLRSSAVFPRIAPLLSVFERSRTRSSGSSEDAAADVDVIVFGAGRYGSRLVERLLTGGLRVLVVDADPAALARAERLGADTLYGDAGEPQLAAELPLESAAWVVSTIPELDVNLALLHGLADAGHRGQAAVTAHTDSDAEQVERAGVALVLRPFSSAAEHGATTLLRRIGPPDR
jgi:Kef-type K+ transport system membrane component KefB